MKTKILTALRQAKDYVSGQELCDSLGVSRTAVWKNIKKLQEEGYVITAVQNKGYCLKDSPDVITLEDVQSFMKPEDWPDLHLFYKDEIDSTNTWAKQAAEQGVTGDAVFLADRQTAGKGRRGRVWESPSGESVYMTILLRPDLAPERASMLTLVKGLSVVEGCGDVLGLQGQIKWPNDMVLSGKKVCGILTEMSAQIDYINYVVIGTGINVNREEFPEELKDKATSLSLELGHPVRRSMVIAGVLKAFRKNYQIFMETGDLTGLLDAYNSILVNKDREIQVLEPGHEYTGIARGINAQGELIVEKTDGSICCVYAGEVSVRGLYGYV